MKAFALKRSVLLYLSFIVIFSLAPPAVQAADNSEEVLVQPAIDNFQKVSQTIWRGAVPSDQAVKDLAAQGIKTLIDLRKDGPGVEHEKLTASQVGLKYVHISMGFGEPSTQTIVAFLQVINNKENQPIFIHCRQGADRTGTLIGVYRVIVQHWSYKKVYAEMRLHHFKPWLLTMRKTVSVLARNNHSQDAFRTMANLAEAAPESLEILPDTSS